MSHERDVIFMQRCIQIAQLGLGKVQPNPLVGCVIVFADKIIGEGFHEEYGKAHAEVNAINSVQNKMLLSDSTMYVSLEPCNHFGKTPPCTDLIIKSKIPRVFVGCKDPFEKVNGSGIEKLKDSGIDVTFGIMEKECEELNKRFFTFHQKLRPYIIVKWAQSKDGFIAPYSYNKKSFHRFPLSNKFSQTINHKWRSQEQTIMVGKNTALIDNPKLTARNYFGKNPLRIIIDKESRLPKSLHVFDSTTPTLVFTNHDHLINKNLKYVKITPNENDINEILKYLYLNQVQSIIIEGGSKLIQSFVIQNLWDEARIINSDKLIVDGLKIPSLSGIFSNIITFGTDELIVIENK